MAATMGRSAGFSTTPRNIGAEFSWEIPQPEPERPPVNPERMRELERAAVTAAGVAPGAGDSVYPPSGIQKRTVDNTKFWAPAAGTPGGREPTGEDGDLGNYGFPLPRYTDTYRATEAYRAGDKFDPKQTLFRYDPETLNIEARKSFEIEERRRKKEEGINYTPGEFKQPHDLKNPVYEGYLRREGVGGLGRAFNPNESAAEGRYLFDTRDHKEQFGVEIQDRLDRGLGAAVRQYLTMTYDPTHEVAAEGLPWIDNPPDTGKKVRVDCPHRVVRLNC